MITNIRLIRKFGFRNKNSKILASRRLKHKHQLITINKIFSNSRKVSYATRVIRKKQRK